jgi:Rieske Fe-S protein
MGARRTVGRRRVIAAAAGLAGGVVAGCSGSPAVAPPPPTPAPPTGPPPDAQAGSVAAPPTAAGSKGTELGPASDVPVGGGRVFENLEVVVTQPVAGRFVGLTAVCTHTGCIVDKVADGLIECPCHGSRYRLDGTVARGPAPRALPARPVTVVDGSIRLS